MNREDDPLRKWLIFSRSEKRGITILLIFIVILLSIRYVQKNRTGNITQRIEIQSEDAPKIKYDPQNKLIDTSDSISMNSSGLIVAPGEIFDPNKADIEDLIDQGIPAHIANRINNYRVKGGVFYEATDLYKIYGIDSILVEELLPWIVIKATRPPAQTHDPFYALSYPVKSELKVEINSADSSIFCKLSGIGTVLSRRIIRYRDILGGFRTIEQLKEVYGINDSLFTTIADNLLVDTTRICKLALNTAGFDELKRHPYLSNYEVKAILSYRQLIGPFTAFDELVENYILSENTYRKVKSYLSLN